MLESQSFLACIRKDNQPCQSMPNSKARQKSQSSLALLPSLLILPCLATWWLARKVKNKGSQEYSLLPAKYA